MQDSIVRFYSNCYFDDVIGFVHADVHTWQDKFKPFNCLQCGKNLYEGRSKGNKSDFVEIINSYLKQITHSRWPYKKNLFIQLSVTNTETKIYRSDIDNLTKTVFDSIKGIVFKDDNQVTSLFAEKGCLNEIPMSSFVFGIKELEKGERACVQTLLWSANENYTKELRMHREKIGRPALFQVFTLDPKQVQVPKEKFNRLMRNYENDKNGMDS